MGCAVEIRGIRDAKGIWEIEEKVIGEDKIIEGLDQEYFNLYSESDKSLNDQEKVVRFSMISIRSFSKDTPINFKKGSSILESWGKILYFRRRCGLLRTEGGLFNKRCLGS